MINLEIEAAKLAHDIDKPFDFALKRRLIATIIDGRAFLLRQTIKSNRHVDPTFIQTFGLPIQKMTEFGNYYIDNYKLSVVTKEKVPTPIRIDSAPFISVTSRDGSINFAYADLSTIKFNSHAGKFVSGTGRYVYYGERVAAYTNNPALLTSTVLVFRGVMENPLEVKDYSNLHTYSEENFPMPMDMMNRLRNLILTGEIQIVPETQEVTINDDN